MKQKQRTKRALLASVLSLVICAAMLVGTTFAWFTDSVTSGKNTIIAGNLDVALYYLDDADQEIAVDADTSVFDENALWEPGYVQTARLKIANEGTLALEYTFDINIFNETTGVNVKGETFRLSDYIQFAVIDGNQTFASRADAIAAAQAAGSAPISQLSSTKNGVLYPAGVADPSEEYVTLVVYMPQTVGNEANYRGDVVPTIELGVNLLATQTPYESDSFDDQYDDTAGEVTYTQAGEYTVDLNQTPIYGNGDWGAIQASGQDVVVNVTGNGVVKAQESATRYAMAVYAGGGATVNIYGGTYTQEITGPDTQYDMIYADKGGHINIYNGTFKSHTPKWTLNILDSAYTAGTASITVYGGTFYQYNPAQATTEPGGKPVSLLADGYTVVQNGDWYTVVKEDAYVDSAETLEQAAAEGGTAYLTSDISLNEALTIPEGTEFTLVLNGKTLTGNNPGSCLVNRGTLTINGDETSHIYTTDVQAQGRHAIENYGTLTINGGVYGSDQSRGNALRNYGTAVINGGTFTACDNYVNGGYAYAIANGDDEDYNNATLTINDAVVYGNMNGAIASDGGKLIVNDGTYTLGTGEQTNLFYMIYTSGFGQVEVNGGTFTRNVNNNHGFFNNAGVGGITINDGTFNDLVNDSITVRGTPYTLTVYGGTFGANITGEYNDYRA